MPVSSAFPRPVHPSPATPRCPSRATRPSAVARRPRRGAEGRTGSAVERARERRRRRHAKEAEAEAEGRCRRPSRPSRGRRARLQGVAQRVASTSTSPAARRGPRSRAGAAAPSCADSPQRALASAPPRSPAWPRLDHADALEGVIPAGPAPRHAVDAGVAGRGVEPPRRASCRPCAAGRPPAARRRLRARPARVAARVGEPADCADAAAALFCWYQPLVVSVTYAVTPAPAPWRARCTRGAARRVLHERPPMRTDASRAGRAPGSPA